MNGYLNLWWSTDEISTELIIKRGTEKREGLQRNLFLSKLFYII